MINVLWFIVLAVMLTAYALLDGFDLGVGVIHLFVGRTEDERALAIDAIGPVWNGNEVWLLAAGGAMVVAFPILYASAFSGFYLALMLVLWLLVGRGLSIEFRHQVDDPLWRQASDVIFSLASLALALLFGVAVGNVLRGVPLDANNEFVGTFGLMLNPFALLCGVLGVSTLALHGSAYLAMKTEGPVQARARRVVVLAWWVALVAVAAVTASSFSVRPDFTRNFTTTPALTLVPLVGLAGIVLVRVFLRRGEDHNVFIATGTFIIGVLGSAAAGLFPRLLPTLAGSPQPGLDIYNAATGPYAMKMALGIYVFGMVIVVVYLSRLYRVWRGKVKGGVYH